MDEKPDVYNIPLNYKTPGKWRSIPIPNLVEGIIAAGIVEYFLMQIPFTFQFRIITFILTSSAIIVLFVHGINGERVSFFLLSWIRYLFKIVTKRYHYHMRKVEIKDVETFEDRNSGKGRTNFDKLISSIKKRSKDKG